MPVGGLCGYDGRAYCHPYPRAAVWKLDWPDEIDDRSEWTAKSGAFWGLLVGLIFAGPLLGLLGGLGLGALIGGKKSQPIDRDFVKSLSEALKPNEAALFLLIKEGDAATLEQLRSYDTPLFTTVLTDDVEEAINNAVEHEEVVAAMEFEADESQKK